MMGDPFIYPDNPDNKGLKSRKAGRTPIDAHAVGAPIGKLPLSGSVLIAAPGCTSGSRRLVSLGSLAAPAGCLVQPVLGALF